MANSEAEVDSEVIVGEVNSVVVAVEETSEGEDGMENVVVSS